MKVLASSAFAMQPPTRNVSAATPARATATPLTPASSARSGLVLKQDVNGRRVRSSVQYLNAHLPSILDELKVPQAIESMLKSLIQPISTSEWHYICINPADRSLDINGVSIASYNGIISEAKLQELANDIFTPTATPV